MSKLIVFDVDGTILNSFLLYEKIVEEYSKNVGLPMPCITTIKHGYGDPDAHDFKWGVSREMQRHHLMETFKIIDDITMSGRPEHTPDLFHGVEIALQHLKEKGHTLAIITSKPEAPLLHLLAYHDIGTMFSTHRSWDDISRRGKKEKPAPDMLFCVMEELGFEPADTVMIGDTTMDICMGRSAGAQTIGVTWGTHPKDHLIKAGAHHIVETNFDDVVPVIDIIFRAESA